MELDAYNAKRHFVRTREPRGRRAPHGGFSFVVQKHAARRLHYDFRLELDGVLLSWAVPKGPSLDPHDRRLAMQTEDHPVAYGSFEGTIPAGEYGAGAVMVWDRGTWQPEGDPRADYARGRLTFTLHGEKLHGRWHLIRAGTDAKDRARWLLFKGTDDDARAGDGALVDAMPNSAATGRSLDEIAHGRKRAAHSKRRHAQTAEATKRPHARHGAITPFTPPQLATLVERPPDGDEWLHEVKLDGYRIVAHVARGRVALFSRNGRDWTLRMPAIAHALAKLNVKSAVLDGEAVVLGGNGVSDFQALQNALGTGAANLTYYVFDLLELDGRDLRREPLDARKRALVGVVSKRAKGVVRFNEYVVGDGARMFARACKLGLEGVVSKRRDAPYHEGRTREWLKSKCMGRQEFVVVGWTDPRNSREHFGALLLAVHAGPSLKYAGRVGTGFTMASLAEIAPALRALSRKTPPVAHAPHSRSTHWVEPRLVCEVEFTEMTDAGILRHPTFRGMRQDKRPEAITMETTVPRVTHANKVLYPDSGITKGDVAAYFERVSEWMLPHVVGRPLMLLRCPNGIDKCFVQKHATAGRSTLGRSVDMGDSEPHVTIDDAQGLIDLAQAGVIEIHTWGCHANAPERPDILVFDLDPDPSVRWRDVISAAELLRERLKSVRLEAFVKTTGGKGLHVACAIATTMTWDAAKDFTRAMAESLVAEAPDRFVATMSKAKRKGKIFVDYLRNARGATFVAPYSPRARPHAPVAMPLAWEELAELRSGDQFTLKNAAKWLGARRVDPWRALAKRPRA